MALAFLVFAFLVACVLFVGFWAVVVVVASRRQRARRAQVAARVHFMSPWTGELFTWWRCGVHDGVSLGTPDRPGHHCRAVWTSPKLAQECGNWTPESGELTAELTAEVLS